MPERTEYAPGTFSWADLGTTDLEGAKSFYSELFGWHFEDMPAGDSMIYSMASKNGKSVAACYEMTPEMRDQGAPPVWMCYVTVANVEESVRRARELGATVVQEPLDVFDSGRMALIADPQGAMLAFWQPQNHIGAQVVNEVGAMCWNDLRTTDIRDAIEFYSRLFGWRIEEAPGSDGAYYTIYLGDRTNGGILPITEQMAGVPPHWGVYFAVEDCDKAVARVEELGGRVLAPPMTTGATSRFAIVADPQGASVSLFSGTLDP
jgi:predicted enzyme related to lactoylglutathione lyase